jgi:NAD(P)-dependent dehydrogenase (short-subunit alcohol dehydrogenase family)
MELAGKVAVVTGAGHGIGAGLVRRFAAEHPAALVVVDHDGPAAAQVAAQTRAEHPEVRTTELTADVVDPDQVAWFVDRTETMFGRLDVLVANAGIGAGGGLEASDDVWRQAWDVNLMAHVHVARLVVPRMLARGGGSFVSVASAAGLLTNLGNAPYSVTKHAAVAFAEWLAVTYGDLGLHVACVCPMGVDTQLLRSGLDKLEGASVAAERVVTVEEAADAVVAGLRSGRFLVLTHAEVAVYEQHRVSDRDRWLQGMQRVRREVSEQLHARR